MKEQPGGGGDVVASCDDDDSNDAIDAGDRDNDEFSLSPHALGLGGINRQLNNLITMCL